MDTNLVQKLVIANLDVISNDVLPLIEKDYARVAASEGLERIKQTVLVSLDENPDNKAQIDLIWNKLGADPELVESVRSALLDAISRVQDPTTQALLTLLLTPITQTLAAVSDDVKPDGNQIKEIWLNAAKSPEFYTFLIDNIDEVIKLIFKNEKLQKFLLGIFKLFGKN